MQRCGDGRLDPGEECDDGNRRDDDGCNATCVRCGPPGTAFTWSANGHCYERHDTPAAFDAADAICGTRGGHLVSYTGQTEVGAVTEAVLRGRDGPHWVGLHAPAPGEAQLWRWREPFVTGMLPSLPPPAPASGLCLAQRGTQLPWLAVPCAQPLPFVCEVPGWVVHRKTGHAYREFFGAHTWYQARDLCAKMGAHLVTIGDPDEHGFLAGHLYGQYWLGASRARNTDPFRWVTDEPFAYQEFVPGDPDVPVPPACLIMGEDRTWRDRLCAFQDQFPYACERE
jgi:cysteine-rich repeat protein